MHIIHPTLHRHPAPTGPTFFVATSHSLVLPCSCTLFCNLPLLSDLRMFKVYLRVWNWRLLVCVFVCAAAVCACTLRGVESHEALICTSLYLMWHATIGWAILQSHRGIGTDRPGWQRGQNEEGWGGGWVRTDKIAMQGKQWRKKQNERKTEYWCFLWTYACCTRWHLMSCSCLQTTEMHLRALNWSADWQGPLPVVPQDNSAPLLLWRLSDLFINSWQRAWLNQQSLAARCLLFLFAIINPLLFKLCLFAWSCVCVCVRVRWSWGIWGGPHSSLT